MSTKTTFKRVALVTVAALGLGVMSVAPSSAVAQLDSLAVSLASTTQNTTETLTATSSVVTATLAGTKGVDTLTVTASIVSGPAYVQPILRFKESTTAEASASGSVATVNPRDTSTVSSATGKFNVYLNAPSVVGTYVVKLTPTGGTHAVSTTVSIVVSYRVYTAAANSASSKAWMITSQGDAYPDWNKALAATNYMRDSQNQTLQQRIDTLTARVCAQAAPTVAQGQAGEGCYTETMTALIGVNSTNAVKTTQANTTVASIWVYQSNASTVSANTAVAAPLTATVVSGPAEVAVGGDSTALVWGATATEGDYGYTYLEKHAVVRSTGKTGKAIITLSIYGTVFATKEINFVGATSKYVGGTQTNSTLKVGSTNSVAITGTDADAISTGTATVYAVSSDTAVATVGTAGTTAVATVAVLGVKGGTATIKLCDTASCTAATVTGEFKVIVGEATADKVALTFAPASPAPGEKVTVTLTATNAGLAIGNGTYSLLSSTGLTTSLSVSGSTLPANDSVTVVDGKATYTFYAPVGSGTLTVSGTEGTATTSTTKAAVTGAITIVNASVDAATVAAEAAEAAAQDATDAALDATTAAEAAGALAQEAVDLVTALSAEVTKLMTALKVQIDSLTNLVTKLIASTAAIAKKLAAKK